MAVRLLLVVAVVLAGCTGTSIPSAEPAAEEPVVTATVAPITDLVRQVLGDRGELHGLVPDGVDSHTYEPRPSDAQMLGQADLFVANGLFLEEPTLRLAEANLPAGSATVTLADETISRDEWAFDFSFPAEQGVPNPHLWLDVRHAMAYVELIRDGLAEVDPAGGDVYIDNASRYLSQLEQLDAAIGQAIDTIPGENRKLVTYHDSWPYFGRRYDIAVVAAVQPSDFAEPSAREVRTIIDQVRDEQVPAVFGSEVFPTEVVRVIAEEAGATYVEELSDDELPGAPGDPEHSYVGMMVANVRTMVTNLGGDPAALDAVTPS
ncbi:MAG: zinc ABC transporter substrate-binding protein [Actinobacteria bacterium]|nr:zinc ABC transporter substrate-binding protein [Actinomycetota bacterium]